MQVIENHKKHNMVSVKVNIFGGTILRGGFICMFSTEYFLKQNSNMWGYVKINFRICW